MFILKKHLEKRIFFYHPTKYFMRRWLVFAKVMWTLFNPNTFEIWPK